MKKLLLLIGIVFLMSCEKEQCWKCAWDTGYTKHMTICNKSESEIVQYEREMSFVTEDGNYVKMNCRSY